jgi:transposase
MTQRNRKSRHQRAAQKWSRGQIEARLANLPPCPNRHGSLRWCASSQSEAAGIGSRRQADASEVCTAALKGPEERLPRCGAIAEAVQRPTMKYVATKTVEQFDLQALHRMRERLVSQRTGLINQIRVLLLERGVSVRQGLRFLRAELPRILASPPDVLSLGSCGSSAVWPKTGAGSTTGSISYPVRLPSWPGRTLDASG